MNKNHQILIFPCLHSSHMCTQCVRKLKADTLEKTYVPNFERQKEGEEIKCPFCRKVCIPPNCVVKVVEERKVGRNGEETEQREIYRRMGDMPEAKALLREREREMRGYDQRNRGLVTTAGMAGVGARHKFEMSPRLGTSVGSVTRAQSLGGGGGRQSVSQGASRLDPLRPLEPAINAESVPKHLRRVAAACMERASTVGSRSGSSSGSSSTNNAKILHSSPACFRQPLPVPALPRQK